MTYPTTAKEAEAWIDARRDDITSELATKYRKYYAGNIGYIQKKLLSSTWFSIILLSFFVLMGVRFNFTIALLSSIALWGLAWLAIRPVIVFTLKEIFSDREYSRVVEEYITDQLREGFRNARTTEECESMENTFGRCLLAVPFDLPFDK